MNFYYSNDPDNRREEPSQPASTMQFVFTDVGVIKTVNRDFVTLTGIDAEYLEGESLRHFVHPEDYDHFLNTVDRLHGDQIQACDLRWRVGDGSYLWLKCKLSYAGEHFQANVQDISARKALEQALGEEDMLYYQGILQSQIDLVCRYLPDTTLVYMNDAYCKYFGIKRDEWLGKRFLSLAIEENQPAILARIEEVLQNPHPKETVTYARGENGSYNWIQWIDYGILNEEGEVVAIQAVGRDITLLKRTEAELAREREIIEFRRRLMSMISHEFRTPLTVIQTASDLLLRYSDRMEKERQEMHLTRIGAQVKRLTQMLDDVLLLERTESQQWIMDVQPLDLKDLFGAMIEDFRMTYTKHQLMLEVDLPEEETHCSDRRALLHIFDNLIGNALRYTPEGKTVSVQVKQTDGWLEVHITDEGIGIPEAEQIRIFDTFYRASNTTGIPGTGLGLSIVKQYTDYLGGTVRFESVVNQGTHFTTSLPSQC